MTLHRIRVRPRRFLLTVYYLTLPLPVLSVHLLQSNDGIDLAAVLVAAALASAPLISRLPDAAPEPLTTIGLRWIKFLVLSYPISVCTWGVLLGAWYLYARQPSGHLNHELQILFVLLLLYVPPAWLPVLASLLMARGLTKQPQPTRGNVTGV